MGNLKIKIVGFLFLFVGTSCDKFEMRGFVTSYTNVNDRFEQSMEWNSMHNPIEIETSNNTYTIHAIGDSHVGGTKNLDNLFKESRENDAEAVVLVGDITTGNEEDFDVLEDHLPPKDSLMYFAVTGNHDLYFDGWKHFYSIFGSSTYYFVVNTPMASDLFICLDTGGGTLGDKQLDWFKDLLKTSRDNYRHCTVFTHNNILRLRPTTSTNPMVEEIQVLLDLFIRHNVNMVVTAHDHKHNSDILGNTTHIIMDALQDINDNASYLKLTINNEDIDFSFIEL